MSSFRVSSIGNYLVKAGRAKNVSDANKRVRAFIRSHKSELGKLDKTFKSHQHGATYNEFGKRAHDYIVKGMNIPASATRSRSKVQPKGKPKAKVTVKSES